VTVGICNRATRLPGDARLRKSVSGRVAQLVRAPRLHRGGPGFESLRAHHPLFPLLPEAIYRGRFAPSPSGPLHFGSLLAAVASYLAARSRGGEWLIRMEDLDTPRVAAGAADSILATLDAYGFEADGDLVYQSDRLPLYEECLERLRGEGLLYACGCTRKEIADSVVNRSHAGEARYPGTCRKGLPAGRVPRAWRLLVADEPIHFTDRLQGEFVAQLEKELGDFVLARADGIISYQLAVVVDDAAQGITEVVRGADLLDSTARQIYLQRCLGLAPLSYLHIPVATGANGDKLSKQNLALPLGAAEAGRNLHRALDFLGQQPAAELIGATPKELWAWAIENWKERRIPASRALAADPALC
jgi:glutamyl-Q tRNA(Asp) synthetase